MKIDENEKIEIWLAGNTGLRNPMRIQEGFIAFSQSPYVGNLHGRDNELGFMDFLDKSGIINNESGKDVSGSHARKWRLMFERYGFIYGQAKRQNGFEQEELGKMDDITPFGRIFIQADTVPAMQECFLRSLGVEQYWLPDGTGHFSPFRWILAIMLELERRTGSSELSRIEFGLWGHTTDPRYNVSEVVDHILDLRNRRKNAPAKRPFDRKEIEERGRHYNKMNDNFLDYCDMNMRYLRISGVLQRKGRGIMIVPSKHIIAEKMAKATASNTPMLEEFRKLTRGAPLPTDNSEIARNVLDDLKHQMKDRGITFDISDLPLNTPAEINNARRKLEEILAQTDEINYAAEQKSKWQEISDYMTLLIRGGGKIEYNEDYVIEVPKDETPAYLEWTLWRAALAINHLKNKPYEMRGFRLDSDFLPVSAAGGGRGDLYCEFEDFTILTEVTMSTSSRQEAMEGEPVRRHVSDTIAMYDKPVYGMFIAVRIDTNTAETFRHGIWYAKGDVKQRLNIVPFSLAQFQKFFEGMFASNQVHPDKIAELIDCCIRKRDSMEAPAWKCFIDRAVDGDANSYSFPQGIYFGSMIYNTEKNSTGTVVGIRKDHILVAYEGEEKPFTVRYGADSFQRGFCKVV
ncbi:MAG: AlwI family type II restriction endonuclease [Clostridia bacterium]|nr:AlwI family type II restriction endonuclease [Clostridia bacterium]